MWFVSGCEFPLGGLLFNADVYVEANLGDILLRIVVEYDGSQHFIGPHHTLSGATLWRNYLLRRAEYIVITVTGPKWANAAKGEAMLLGKLSFYLGSPEGYRR